MTEAPSQSEFPALVRMVGGYRETQALYVAAKLGIADLLADGPMTSEDLAKRLGVQPRPLFRVLRLLASHGVFTQDTSERFGLARMGEPLRTDHPMSIRGFAIFQGDFPYRAAAELLHTVRTGETAFDRVFGAPLFDYLGQHPEASAIFNRGMSDSPGMKRNPIGSVRFEGRRVVLDVGGGRGALLAEVLERNAHLRGVLFDIPQGVTEAGPYLESRGVADRCRIVTGDAFRAIPDGADVIVFSRVLHDWPDDKARLLLRNARKAIAPGGLLLLSEAVIPEGATRSPTKDVDLSMLIMAGGAERTEAEWRSMLASTGFEPVKVTRTGEMFDLIEARPV